MFYAEIDFHPNLREICVEKPLFIGDRKTE